MKKETARDLYFVGLDVLSIGSFLVAAFLFLFLFNGNAPAHQGTIFYGALAAGGLIMGWGFRLEKRIAQGKL